MQHASGQIVAFVRLEWLCKSDLELCSKFVMVWLLNVKRLCIIYVCHSYVEVSFLYENDVFYILSQFFPTLLSVVYCLNR